MRRALVLLAAALVATLVGFTPSSAQAASPMSEAKAGRYYLKVACAGPDYYTRFDALLYGSDNYYSASEFKGRKAVKIRRVARKIAKQEYKFARKVANPPAPWPTSVRKQAAKIARENARLAYLARRIGSTTSGTKVVTLLDRRDTVALRVVDSVTLLRLELDLPAAGQC